MRKVGEWWEGEGRAWKVREWEGDVEDRKVVGRGRGAVQKVGEWWKGEGCRR